MNNQPAQAEQEQYPVYLNSEREWHPRQIKAKNWEYDTFGFYRSCKVFFLKDGRIGMEYGGRVVVRSSENWMSSAVVRVMPEPDSELYLK